MLIKLTDSWYVNTDAIQSVHILNPYQARVTTRDGRDIYVEGEQAMKDMIAALAAKS